MLSGLPHNLVSHFVHAYGLLIKLILVCSLFSLSCPGRHGSLIISKCMPVLCIQSKFEYQGLLIKASVISRYDRPGAVRCGVYHDASSHALNFLTGLY